jgi:hypothetical protein
MTLDTHCQKTASTSTLYGLLCCWLETRSGLGQGGLADRRYNLSFIVGGSARIGKPIIIISIQYRQSALEARG